MFSPDGQPADKIDKIMLLSMWTKAWRKEKALVEKLRRIISAGMGQPTYPINMHTINYYLAYWHTIEKLVKKALEDLDKIEESAAIDYGHPQGDEEARKVMAEAMTSWYQSEIKPEHILFTTGGAGALRVIFESLQELYKDTPNYRIITPFPYYTLYADYPRHRLYPIPVMNEKGYRLTAEALEKSILEAYELAKSDQGTPKAILFCNPNNPLGTVINEDELKKIALVLQKYPDLHIIIDEAYAEMAYEDVPSLLKLAPSLKSRATYLRSGTKGLSAAGERMAMLIAFDEALMKQMLAKNISLTGHAPISAQRAYAQTMKHLKGEELEELKVFYKKKVDYVTTRLKSMGAEMSDPDYKVQGTFYVLADFSDMLGAPLPDTAKRALGRTGKIKTDEELAYALLFEDDLMIAPLSYFGLPNDKGFMRITCSRNLDELEELMNRLETRLLVARKAKKKHLEDQITHLLPEFVASEAKRFVHRLSSINNNVEEDCISLKKVNTLLKEMLSEMRAAQHRIAPELQEKAATKLQSFFKEKEKNREKTELDDEWANFVSTMFSENCTSKTMFLSMPETERKKFTPWLKHLEEVNKLKKQKNIV